MSQASRATDLATLVGGDVKDYTTDLINGIRLDRDARAAIRTYNKTVLSRIGAAKLVNEIWTSSADWSGTAVIASGRMYSTAGLTRATPASTRWVARTTLHVTGTTGKFAYFGCGASGATNDLVGIGQGSASTTAAILRGANISASALVIPRSLPVLSAGDYILTVARDETNVSFTIQATTGGQSVWGARVPVSAFPGGVINTIFMSANDTAAGGMNFGPVSIYSELAVPPSSAWTLNSYALYGAGKPLSFYRSDPITGFGHVISIPGDDDASAPSPIMLFMHQASTGVAITPWSETRMANVTNAMEGAGYIIVSSDNGPGITGGGTQDKFANQAGQDDYAALVDWTRQHFYTGSLVLLGPSQGSFFAQNFLLHKQLGDIAAVATISGGSNLIVMEQDVTYQAVLRAAYGASDTPSFIAAALPNDPLTKGGWRFRGVPQRFYIGTADTTAPPAVQTTPFVNKITPYSPEESVVSLAVGHLDDSLYQGTDLLAFYQKYVRPSEYIVAPDSPKLVTTITSSVTLSPTGGYSRNELLITALAAAATIAAPSGTPVQGNVVWFRIKDNGTARALTWNSIYRAFGAALPTTTVAGKTLYVAGVYNDADSKWDMTAVAQEV